MSSIKQKLDSLPQESKRLLIYAFEHQISQYVTLPDGSFIGVNTNNLKHLQITDAAGVWTIGVDKSKTIKPGDPI